MTSRLEAKTAHNSEISCCDVSLKGILATSGGDQIVKLWRVTEDEIKELDISPLKGHTYGVNFVRFSPYGTIIASASTDGTVNLWDSLSGSILSTFFSPTGYSFRVCSFSPDASYIAAGGDDDTVYIWRISDKELLRTITSHEATVFSLAFSPDSSLLVSSDSSGRMLVWSAEPGHHTLLTDIDEAHDLGVTGMDFCPAFTKSALETRFTLATCGNDGFLSLWSIRTGEKNCIELREKVFAHDNAAMSIRYNSKGDRIATSGGDKTCKLWNTKGPHLECLTVLDDHPRYVTSCSWFRNRNAVATTSSRGIRVHSQQQQSYSSDYANVTLASSNSSSSLTEPDCDREARFQFSLTKSKARVELASRIAPPTAATDITCVDIFKNTLAISSGQPLIHLWSLEGADGEDWRECEESPLRGHNYTVYSLHFGHTGDLISGSLDGDVIIWDVSGPGGRILHRLSHPDRIGFRTVRLSGNGKVAAAGGDDDSCLVWDLQVPGNGGGCRRECVLREHDNTVFAVDISSDQRFIVTACSGERIKVWDLNSVFDVQKSIHTVEETHDLGVNCCCFLPRLQNDGTAILATGGNDSQVKIWKLHDQGKLELQHQLCGHGSSIMCLKYSPDSQFLGSSSGDRTARIWDTTTYKCLYVVDLHARYVTSCAFSADSRLFVTCCENYVKVWKLNFANPAPAFQSLNIKDWSGVEVRAWLDSLGLSPACPQFVHFTGSTLLNTSQAELEGLGLSETEATRLLEMIQHLRHGLHTVRSAEQDEGIPEEFLCPITHELMENPVQLSDGFIYEEMAIKEWLLTRRRTSPLTNLEIGDDRLTPCPELRQKISSYRKSKPQ